MICVSKMSPQDLLAKRRRGVEELREHGGSIVCRNWSLSKPGAGVSRPVCWTRRDRLDAPPVRASGVLHDAVASTLSALRLLAAATRGACPRGRCPSPPRTYQVTPPRWIQARRCGWNAGGLRRILRARTSPAGAKVIASMSVNFYQRPLDRQQEQSVSGESQPCARPRRADAHNAPRILLHVAFLEAPRPGQARALRSAPYGIVTLLKVTSRGCRTHSHQEPTRGPGRMNDSERAGGPPAVHRNHALGARVVT